MRTIAADIHLAEEVDDGWGLFVDTEERDAELTRHSKVLSRREIGRI